MIRTQMRQVIELISKHPKMCCILRCESPYFHHCISGSQQASNSTTEVKYLTAKLRMQLTLCMVH